ncbi:hydrolase [Caulobacter phage CcrRogue]|uniref:peptidyl-tRNA hydrolase n=1 Tax=Caulobacter phage CcrRogue TaxID=2927986 RepID=K4JN52_9CAUD|nr:hydrolase [Caulobacter phage CcrRogue]AFU86644.1 putative peptidyl-tRNA hydrolase [Caulobacter phage CcrRogue]
MACFAGKSKAELRLYAIVSQEALDAMTVAKRSRKPEDKSLNIGKLSAQAGHAYLHAWWDAMERFPKTARQYRYSQSAAKIALHTGTNEELEALYERFREYAGATLVVDAGRTVFEKPTVTFVGIGPITEAAFKYHAPSSLKLLR